MPSHLQLLCIAGYLERNNDTPKLNIHKYNSYNITQIFINRLSLTMQIFIAMNYLMLEKYLHFKKRISRNFFLTP